MDRVRAAIFSSLGDLVLEARVLDLFAGSGALGIEALSRGSRSAVFVEHHGPTSSVIRRNLQYTKLEGSVQQMDAFRFLDLYGGDDFDLIFADPPYLKDIPQPTPAGNRQAPMQEPANLADRILSHPGMKTTAASALLVLECERRQPLPSLGKWQILSDRNYGESRILLLRPDR
jgi:16S rRNA (guanine966-N2)-methyltransferase